MLHIIYLTEAIGVKGLFWRLAYQNQKRSRNRFEETDGTNQPFFSINVEGLQAALILRTTLTVSSFTKQGAQLKDLRKSKLSTNRTSVSFAVRLSRRTRT
jgi:hypothetical protein